MSELTKNVEVLDNISNQRDQINYLIKKFKKLNEMIGKYKTSRYYWELHYSTLSINVWSGQIKYIELQKKEARLRTTILETNKLIDLKKQELKSLIAEKAIHFSKQCDHFRIRNTKFTVNFLSAQKEYSAENLSNDIKQCSQEYERTSEELLMLRNKLINLEINYGFNCLSFNQENGEILKINTLLADVMENNNIKLLKVKSAQDTLKKLKNELKQKQMLTNFLNE